MRDFKHTVNVLVQAFLNGTLQHYNCYACAVGNMIAAANNIKFEKLTTEALMDPIEHHTIKWKNTESIYEKKNFNLNANSQEGNWMQAIPGCNIKVQLDKYKGKVKEMIDSTGYSIYELANIEEAFERANRKGDFMFNGLMAVVDVLAEIHNIDLTEVETAKKLFEKSILA